MERLWQRVAAKQAELAWLRAQGPGRVASFEHVQDIELTWSSNAVEGNTSAAETALVFENGITIGGKPLKDHLEAIDHFAAIGVVRALAGQSRRVTEGDIRNLHRLVVQRSLPESAGRYADQGRYVLTRSRASRLSIASRGSGPDG